MRLWRRGYKRDDGGRYLADEELTEGSSSSPDFFRYATLTCGFDSNRKEFFLGIRARPVNGSTHWYQLHLTPRDMKILLSRYLGRGKMPDVERKLWEVLLYLWERRLKKTRPKTSE